MNREFNIRWTIPALFSSYIAVAVFSITLTGCATWSKHGVVLRGERPRLAILPVESTLKLKKLTDLLTVSEDEPKPLNEQELIAAEMLKVTDEITSKVENGLRESQFFTIVPREDIRNALTVIVPDWPTTPVSDEQAREIGESVDATVVLLVELSGYGKIKKKWQMLLIGSGIVEGVVQGAIAIAVVDNTWVAVGVGAEEILQELLTWGGGTYLFNRIFTPVILDGRLLSVTDGKIIWSDTAFARLNRKALKQLPEEQRKKKEIRLDLSADKAIKALLKDLNKSALRNAK
jgi:hypothetical protein